MFLEYLDRYTSLGIDTVNSLFSLAELLTCSGLQLTSLAALSAIKACDESIRIMDGLFGSTESSRAVAAIVQLLKRELIEDEHYQLARSSNTIVAVAGLIKALAAYACLQMVTWKRSGRGEHGLRLVYEKELVNGRVAHCVAAHGAPKDDDGECLLVEEDDEGVAWACDVNNPPVSQITNKNEAEFLNIPLPLLASRYMRHASAAYGPQFLHLLGISKEYHHVHSFTHPQHPNHLTYARHTGIPAKDVLCSSYTPHHDVALGINKKQKQLHTLMHYVSYDRALKAVVLTLRGTMGLSDVLTDLCADYSTIEPTWAAMGTKHAVHGGMFESAKLLAAMNGDVVRSVRQALLSEPTYGLVLTGHSLGGGVAALLSVLWADWDAETEVWRTRPTSGLPAGRRINCIGFGVPCVMSFALGRRCERLITSVIHRDDVVSSLSLGLVRDFKNVAVSLYEEPKVAEEILAKSWSNDEEAQDWLWSVMKTMQADMTHEKLYPPGTVYQISQTQVTEICGVEVTETTTAKMVRVEDVARRFGEALFSKTMFTDHSPKYYEDCLSALSA